MEKNDYLESVLDTHKIGKEQQLLDKHIVKKDSIKEALQKKYSEKIYSPFNSGSYAKNTAVNKKFDFDLVVPYKRNAFDTLESMYTEVYDFLYEKYGSEANIRKQKVSIGLEFYSDTDGDIVKVDIVPGRELNLDQYKDDSKLNLYVYNQYGKFEKGSDRLRTNVKAQIDNIKGNAEKGNIRQIIRLLKVWKIHNEKSPKSFFLELITIKAFDKKNVEGDLWERLKIVLEFIRDEVKDISLPDPGNSTNDIADTLSDTDKIILSNDMKFMLERIESNHELIKSYFPTNEKHLPKDDEKESSRYRVKRDGVSVPPITRFG